MGSRTGRLSHERLCTFRSLTAVNELADEIVNTYLERAIPSAYLADQIAAFWYPYSTAVVPLSYEEIVDLAPIDNPPNGYDIITDAIRDDCVVCFDRLSQTTKGPNYHVHGCNDGGWSYVAIACCSNSFCMLKEFCKENPLNPAIIHLATPANHNCEEVSPLDIMAQRQDLQFFERLFILIAPLLAGLGLPTLIRDGLSRQGRLDLCKFATPDLLVELHSVGVRLCDTLTTESSSWHAGVINGPGFLNYLFENSPISIEGPLLCTHTPLFAAVDADRLDSVQWLVRHGADVNLSRASEPRCTPVHLAATKGSDASETILQELLSAPSLGTISTEASGMLLYSLVEGLIEACYHEAVRNDIDIYEFMARTNVHEERAIRKCKHVLGVTEAVRLIRYGPEARWLLPDDPALVWHSEAKRIAISAGFVNIVYTMEHCCAYMFAGCGPSAVFRSRICSQA
jgi:hypothetical protein